MRFVMLPLVLGLSAVACGGSSSETPPPLQPDPTSERYTGPRVPSADEDAAQPSRGESAEEDTAELPRRSAAATWGTGKVTPSPSPSVPTMISPTALPAPPSSSAAPAAPAVVPGSLPSNY
jgi:hypothetical protein